MLSRALDQLDPLTLPIHSKRKTHNSLQVGARVLLFVNANMLGVSEVFTQTSMGAKRSEKERW